MSPIDKVRAYIRFTTRHTSEDLDDLVQSLAKAGIRPLEAECLIAFVPIAFTHALFDGFGIHFKPGFEIRNLASGASARGQLQDEPLYVAARKMAAEMVKGDESACKIVLQIAGQSAELEVINKLVGKGSAMTDIALTEPVMVRLPVEYLTARKPRKRWQFWK